MLGCLLGVMCALGMTWGVAMVGTGLWTHNLLSIVLGVVIWSFCATVAAVGNGRK